MIRLPIVRATGAAGLRALHGAASRLTAADTDRPVVSPYIATLLTVAAASTTVLAILAVLAGVTLEAFLEGAPVVVFTQMAVLSLLLWPAGRTALRALDAGRASGWWGIALYPVAIVAFMAAFFGKPFDLAAIAEPAKLLPISITILLMSWLYVEAADRRRNAAQAAGPQGR